MTQDMADDRGPGCYAGIGARKTPRDVLELMQALAARLAIEGWVLRTGGARGADQAFMAGADPDGVTELYLPWLGFSGFDQATLLEPEPGAWDLAAAHHPRWKRLGGPAQALMARNSHQVLGRELDCPCDVVVCWTPDGSLDGSTRTAGGTGQALRLAAAREIPVRNLARADHRERVERFLAGAA